MNTRGRILERVAHQIGDGRREQLRIDIDHQVWRNRRRQEVLAEILGMEGARGDDLGEEGCDGDALPPLLGR